MAVVVTASAAAVGHRAGIGGCDRPGRPVVGGMLSLAGFSFGKAVDRSREARERWLQVNKVYDSISKIEGHVRFASEALWKVADPSAAPVLIDCRRRMTESVRMVALLDNTLSPADRMWTFLPAQQAILGKLGRDIDAATDRLYSSRMELLSHLDVERDDAEWALFFVLVDDLLKVQERLNQDVSDALAEVGRMGAGAKTIPVNLLRRSFRRLGQARSSAT